jgi:hypothetical protein
MSKQTSATSSQTLFGIDPWQKGLLGDYDAQVPQSAIYLGTFLIWGGVDKLEADFHIHLSEPGVMELWKVNIFDDVTLQGRMLLKWPAPATEQYMQLLLKLFASWVNFQCPIGLSKEGLLKQRHWIELEKRLDAATRRKDRKEFNDCFGLLKLADELNMNAVHEGGESKLFIGRCPAHHLHHIHLHPELGNWMCGWCGINGEVDDLKKFFEKHRS